MPCPSAKPTDWFSKLFALCFVEFILLTVTGLCGIIMQTIAGYYHYELLQYVKELYFITFPQVLIFALLALFVQTVVSNKFIGHGIVIGIFVMHADPVQLRLGKHPLPLRQHPSLHLLRHERLRPLCPVNFLVHHILAIDLLHPGRYLHRVRPPRL